MVIGQYVHGNCNRVHHQSAIEITNRTFNCFYMLYTDYIYTVYAGIILCYMYTFINE